MIAYLLRRLGTSIIVLIGISIFIFLLLHAIFPSPARVVLGLRTNNAAIAAWNKENGFDDPVLVQYLRYMNNLLHGNLGYSYAENQTVACPVRRAPGPQRLPVRHLASHRDPDRLAAGDIPGRQAELAR